MGLAVTGLAQNAASMFAAGSMSVGCNYWARHAGINMWRNWNPQQIEKDFDLLVSQGMSVVRVFPLWPDFQPLVADRGWQGEFVGYLQNDAPLKNCAAVDDEMMARFRFVCDAAEKRRLKLIVGLITGWMSGRMFVPSAFEGRNVLTSPEVMVWQTRFIRYFVGKMKDHPAILAWDMGNECNCMGKATADEMWVWFHAMASEIRLADPTRKIVSGLHSVSMVASDATNVRQMEELMDVVTTHPYPLWTPNCNFEPFNSIRNACHAPCETTLYANLSRRIGIVEEAGSLGPCIASEEVAAATMRMQLFGSWAAGVPMYLWWCAFDQDKLAYSPYARNHVERELGLFTSDGEPKATVRELKAFTDFLRTLPFRNLPLRQIDATVVMSETEDGWSVAQGAWMLSRRAGFDVCYARAEDPLPEASFYILPSGRGLNTYSRAAWMRIADKVREGATVFVTLGNGSVLSELKRIAGVETVSFYQKPRTLTFEIEGRTVSFDDSRTRTIRVAGAKVLVADSKGEPLMTEFALGKGRVLFFNGAPETQAPLDAWPVYRLAAQCAGVRRKVKCDDPDVGLTEHPAAGGRTIVVAVNYADCQKAFSPTVDGSVGKMFRGTWHTGTVTVGPNDVAVFEVLNP